MPIDWDLLLNAPATAAYGEIVTYIPAGAAAFALSGVFDEAYEEVSVFRDSPVTSALPQLGLQLSAFPAGVTPAQGDQVVIRNLLYTVRQVQPDSHGWVRLLLNEAA